MRLSIHQSVCPQGGYPYPIMLCNISQNAMRQPGGTQSGTPPGGVPGPPPPGGVPSQVPPWGGTQNPPGGEGVPSQVPPPGVPRPPRGGTQPPGGYLVRYPPRGGYPVRYPPPARREGVLTTRRAVCLLRSRRRTFLLTIFFALPCVKICQIM